ncbi:carbohydrate-binding protein [Puniceicoccales bacterium CK1056]|uniref:glucan endo-1,3-beta-D-glucosidase n=1 Tax=Oceanipulchritudo coccoides TaxID=2706888 RepID=A0A6B2M416_9BACT|nr:glycosyl hydrolase [Oceanipulchritudo coccoides]NDV62969.1 carbohydrate-binding protein [Oceanipulchritudo coccoides]
MRPLFRINTLAILATSFVAAVTVESAIVPVDSGSYTTTFPGTDIAGRNGIPGGTPQLSGNALGRPVPTNDWWSKLLNSNHADNLFNYPMAMRTLPGGLDIGLVEPVSTANGSSEPQSPFNNIVVGVSGLAATQATVNDYSDWTVTIGWDSGGHSLRATTGIGMPFVYFTKGDEDIASITVEVGTVSIVGETLVISNSEDGASFAVYGPADSVWSQAGSTYTSSLDGENYWSMAILPAGTPATNAAAWRQYAFVEPTNTAVAWTYDEASATLRTDFTTTVTVHEESGTSVIQGLLPHQWSRLSADSPALTGQSLSSIRGELKLIASNTFATERAFQGILPTLPAVGSTSPGFSPAKLHEKIILMEDDTLATWTDSYNEGQVMNRLIQTARAAHETGDIVARDKMIATVKERLEDWLTAEIGEVAFLFYYQPTWTAMIGYPAGHGQDNNLNDHHFHWGYFIHAAAFMEQFEPGWASQWGGMVDLLVRDAASPDRNDPLFPFLRSFSPFAGHAWANGFATFPFGNDQESSSESMQFNSSLIHWGAVTGNTAIRDLGIYLYTTEQTAIEEYWLDINNRTFKPGYGYSLASRIWGNGYDNQTFWTGDIAAAYGIELYPIHGGSFYLGENTAYAASLWTEMTQNTGILQQAANDNLWHDIYWQFLAFTDPAAAIALYDANPSRNLKFGVSDAQTYYWLHSMNALGQIDSSVTADDPLAVVFNKEGTKTYVAHNYSTSPKTVQFSDGASLLVAPSSLATSVDLPFSGSISTPFSTAPAGNTVPLTITIEGDDSSLTSVEFYDGSNWIGTLYEAPYTLQTEALSLGSHTFYARLYAGTEFAITGLTTVKVGDAFPFTGTPIQLPGTFEAGAYDLFEGGVGQGITYQDASVGNNGDYRTSEYVDASSDANEGAVVGWISDGEWLEYTVDVATSGLYSMDFRYASGNDAGGGPLFLELDGRIASPQKTVPTTGGWSTFATQTLNNIELREGIHVLRLNFAAGELNLGRLTFTYTGPLGYQPPVADAGIDGTVVIPATTATLDGSGSTAPSGGTLSYFWEQVTGPAVATISSPTDPIPSVTDMVANGIYRFKLTIDDGANEDFDEVEILRGDLAARPPTVSILSPSSGSNGLAGQALTINMAANDPDGEVVRVDLFNGDTWLGSLTEAPYTFEWYPPEGTHSLSAEVVDSDNLTATSSTVSFTANPPQPCTEASTSGNFAYEFSSTGESHSITFIPSRSGVGANIVIFYYGIGGGPYPGYIISPNTPFSLNVSDGDTIGFYFTYSVPEGGERNSIDENASYTIGTCGVPIETDPDIALLNWQNEHFDPVDLANPALEGSLWGAFADPDKDGLLNTFEFITGEDPLVANEYPLNLHTNPVTGKVMIRYPWRAGLPAELGWISWSHDLATWSDSGTTTSAVNMKDGVELREVSIEAMDTNPDLPIFIRMETTP